MLKQTPKIRVILSLALIQGCTILRPVTPPNSSGVSPKNSVPVVSDQLKNYSSGLNFEIEKQWEQALLHYRNVTTDPLSPRPLITLAVYRMSYCYSALGDDKKSLASLMDSWIRKADLPIQIRLAELPARLALGYAHAGNKQVSAGFFAQAERGLRQAQSNKDSVADKDWLARTLFYMGYFVFTDMKLEFLRNHMELAARSQQYLLRAAEQNNRDWSQRAVENLFELYQFIWSINSSPSRADQQKSDQFYEKQEWDTGLLVNQMILDFRASIVSEIGSPYTEKMINFVADQENKVQNIFRKRPAGEGLTDAAQKREGVLRSGKVVTVDNQLEKDALKRKKQIPVRLPADASQD